MATIKKQSVKIKRPGCFFMKAKLQLLLTQRLDQRKETKEDLYDHEEYTLQKDIEVLVFCSVKILYHEILIKVCVEK